VGQEGMVWHRQASGPSPYQSASANPRHQEEIRGDFRLPCLLPDGVEPPSTGADGAATEAVTAEAFHDIHFALVVGETEYRGKHLEQLLRSNGWRLQVIAYTRLLTDAEIRGSLPEYMNATSEKRMTPIYRYPGGE
jgi:hypothetical protein